MSIESNNFEGKLCRLVDGLGLSVEEGRTINDEFGDSWTVTGGRAPQSAASTGHVWVDHYTEGFSRTFYVGVLKLSWELVE